MAAASGRLGLAGTGGGGEAGGWVLARGCRGSRHECLRARSPISSRLRLRAFVPHSLVWIGKLRLRDGGGTPKVTQQKQSLAWSLPTPGP